MSIKGHWVIWENTFVEGTHNKDEARQLAYAQLKTGAYPRIKDIESTEEIGPLRADPFEGVKPSGA